MTVQVVKIEALRALGKLIELTIPQLAGHVCVADTPPNEHEAVPNVSIEPSKWTWDPDQESEHATLPGDVVVWNVGDHNAPCVISVVAASRTQRAAIEQQITDLFLSQRHPLTDMSLAGCIVIPVTSCQALSSWLAIFDLETEEWNDTLAQDRRFESRIVINASIPALVIQRPVYTIDELILGITHDMTTTFTPATAIPPAVELVTINEDGTITAAT